MNDTDFETDLPSSYIDKDDTGSNVDSEPEDMKVEEIKPNKKTKEDSSFKLDKEVIDIIFVILSSLLAHNDIITNFFNITTQSDTISFILQSILCGVIFYAVSLFYKRI